VNVGRRKFLKAENAHFYNYQSTIDEIILTS
jgi:hypothetical protein